MTEKEFIKMAEEELFPALSYRFGNGSVSVLEDFESFAIPPEVYEYFNDLKVDQLPPKSKYLSPFTGIWSSILNNVNQEFQKAELKNKNPDQLWEEIELAWSTKSRFQTNTWSQEIGHLQTKINSIVEQFK